MMECGRLRPQPPGVLARRSFLSQRGAGLSVVLGLTLSAALTSCRTARPAGTEQPLPPLTVSSSEAVVPELQRIMHSLHAVRSLMRVRLTKGDRTESFRAQLLVEPKSGRMELAAYTPIGTAATTIIADGQRVVVLDHVHQTAWQGNAAELAQSVGFFDPATPPAAWALDLLGFPASGDFAADEAGVASGTVGDMRVVFDPPVFPPKHVAVTRGTLTLDVTHLELASTDASVRALEIPRGYRCCVRPEM